MQICSLKFFRRPVHFHVLHFHVLHFHVQQFHALLLRPFVSRPAFSRPAFSAPPAVLHFDVYLPSRIAAFGTWTSVLLEFITSKPCRPLFRLDFPF